MRHFLVIGASSGIGRQLAQHLASEGNQVYATYHSNEQPDEAGISYHHLDVTAEEWDLDFLPEQLDGLAYCPGSINLKPFHRIKPADFMADYQLQVLGAIQAVQHCLPQLKAAPNAALLFFSTVAVQHGFNFHSQVASSKGALEGLARSLAAELAPKIRVNCIAPSLTDTPLAAKLLSNDQKKEANAERHPLKRIGSTEDIAEAASFLLTERSGWISGQVLQVDGGMSSIRG